MKKILILISVILSALCLSSCGTAESEYIENESEYIENEKIIYFNSFSDFVALILDSSLVKHDNFFNDKKIILDLEGLNLEWEWGWNNFDYEEFGVYLGQYLKSSMAYLHLYIPNPKALIYIYLFFDSVDDVSKYYLNQQKNLILEFEIYNPERYIYYFSAKI